MDDGLASPLLDSVTAEPWNRSDTRSAQAATDELFRNGTMDGLSAICTDCTSSDYKFRYHGGVPAVPILLGSIETDTSIKLANRLAVADPPTNCSFAFNGFVSRSPTVTYQVEDCSRSDLPAIAL